MVCRPADTCSSITGTDPRSRPSMNSVPGGFEFTETKPCAATGAVGGAGGGAVCRRLSVPRRGAGGGATRSVSTGTAAGGNDAWGGEAGGGASLFLPSARYPPTPTTTTTSAPSTMPTLERFFFSAPSFNPARGIGVVGAVVTSVGASAATFRGGGRRWPLVATPAFGTATGCSGQTAVANSSIVPKR